jgi:hypothetical protein
MAVFGLYPELKLVRRQRRAAEPERLRDELHFASTTQLMLQVGRDVAAARAWFADHPLDSLDLVLP